MTRPIARHCMLLHEGLLISDGDVLWFVPRLEGTVCPGQLHLREHENGEHDGDEFNESVHVKDATAVFDFPLTCY